MIPYAIGLDIGISSVGWAVVALDEEDRPYGIIGMGARIFDLAEQPKTGASLAAPRREARCARRRTRRRRFRKEEIRHLLLCSGVITPEQLQALYDGQSSDIYALRVKALDEMVTGDELARILIHISQRRGFRSNRKALTSKEDGELLSAVNANKVRMAQSGYRTVAEMYCKDPLYADSKRNKGWAKDGKYKGTVSRDMIEDEVHRIFSAQRALGNPMASETLEEAYLAILLRQRSFDVGPGESSPYAGSQINRMVGNCTLDPTEQRAAKSTYSFEYFSLLQAVNHIRIITGGDAVPLDKQQREQLIALAHRSANLDYAKIRKTLGLSDAQAFNTVYYRSTEERETAEKKTKFNHLRAYHQMRTAYDRVAKGHFADLTIAQRNAIAQTLSIWKSDEKIRGPLQKVGLSEADIDVAETLNFSKFGHLSVKACDKIIPFLEQGMPYSDACEAAGYAFQAEDKQAAARFLPPLDEQARNTLTSPVVLRAVSQAIKVVNAIIRERGGSPTYINVELARELSKNHSERDQIQKRYEDNQRENARLMERIRAEYRKASPTGQDLVKLKLYQEQAGVCAYSLRQMSLVHLFDPDYAEVDHIVPYSVSFDDSYNNKVLVLTGENRNKGNRLPLQYLTGKRRDDFIVWVNTAVHNERKRRNLLKESITDSDRKNFRDRNLQDTKTASTFLMNYIRERLEFAPFSSGRKKHVTAVGGPVTAYLRKRWGIAKIRANGDLHHAVDALVIACATDGMIQAVSRYADFKESRYMAQEGSPLVVDAATGEVVKTFPTPWPQFRHELEARLSSDPLSAVLAQHFPVYCTGEVPVRPLFVSRAPRRKVTGAAHKETVKSAKALESGLLVVKTPLSKLKLGGDGEITNYYMPQSDRLLYEALKARLQQFGGDGKKAFAEPFHKPRHDGTPGPVVNTVKLCEVSTLNVPVHGGKGVADNDSMVRIDVFHVEGDGYYFVPIYVADTLKPDLPNKACVALKPEDQWKEMREENFLFSLYHNDLIKATHRKGITLKVAQENSDLPPCQKVKSPFLYFISANINTASISCLNHDASYQISSLGFKTLEALEKYSVDPLGNTYPVKKESRQRFQKRRN